MRNSRFFQTTNKNDFDSLFYFISEGNPNPTIPLADFSAKKVISIVKYGNNFYDLKVADVSMAGNVLIIDYTSTLVSGNMTWTAAIPLIVTLNADYQKIEFIENEKLVKEMVR
jgi:hypothetical protein